MSIAAHCTPEPRAVPELPPHVVSLFVADTHPLLQLKRALDWPALQAVMVRHWRAAGKNVDGRPGLPWPVALYVPLSVLMAVKALSRRGRWKNTAQRTWWRACFWTLQRIRCRICAIIQISPAHKLP